MAPNRGEATKPAGDLRWTLESGEHVCWLVRSRAEYEAGERELLARAAQTGESVMILGRRVRTRHQAPGVTAGLDARAGRGGSAMVDLLREQALRVGRSGRPLRILARMEHLAPPDAGLEELIAREMDVAELTGHGVTSVVCAYQHTAWQAELLSGVSAVHARLIGPPAHSASFRIVPAAADAWAVHGTVGYEAAAAFEATMRALLARSSWLRLDCAQLELIDAAGWRALIAATTGTPGAQVLLERVNDTVAAAWRLSGYENGTTQVLVRS